MIVHCSSGTGRTGTLIACDIAMRSLEQPARSVDIPDIVYFVRNGRAGSVATREQYEFIYKVSALRIMICVLSMRCNDFPVSLFQLANMYAARMIEEAAEK